MKRLSLLFAILVCSLATMCQAQSTSAVCQTAVQGPGHSDSDNGPGATAISCNPAAQGIPGSNFSNQSSAASANYGVLRATGSGSATSSSGDFGAGYLAQAGFNDTVTFTTSTPEAGHFTLTVVSSGTQGYGGSGDFSAGEWEGIGTNNPPFVSSALAISINGTDIGYQLSDGLNTTSQNSAQFSETSWTSIGGGLYTISDPIFIYLTVSGSCVTYNISSCNVFTDFYDTSQVSSLLFYDTSGNLLSGTLSSASGTNYNAIPGDNPGMTPEPSTLTLFGTGIIGLVAYLRRRTNSLHTHKMQPIP